MAANAQIAKHVAARAPFHQSFIPPLFNFFYGPCKVIRPAIGEMARLR